jgi:hypothetical protein
VRKIHENLSQNWRRQSISRFRFKEKIIVYRERLWASALCIVQWTFKGSDKRGMIPEQEDQRGGQLNVESISM